MTTPLISTILPTLSFFSATAESLSKLIRPKSSALIGRNPRLRRDFGRRQRGNSTRARQERGHEVATGFVPPVFADEGAVARCARGRRRHTGGVVHVSDV